MTAATSFELIPTQTAPLNPIWNFGGNPCHAPLWLRDDLRSQLETCRDRLGFTRLRAHGTVDDNGIFLSRRSPKPGRENAS